MRKMLAVCGGAYAYIHTGVMVTTLVLQVLAGMVFAALLLYWLGAALF